MNLVRSFAVLVATVFLFASAPDAHANPKYASIVLDMDSGTVLHSSRADKTSRVARGRAPTALENRSAPGQHDLGSGCNSGQRYEVRE